MLHAFQQCIETGEAYDMDFEFIDFRKKRKWIRTGAQSIREGEEVVAVLGYITDITREKQEEIDLKRAKEKAEENDSLKSAFLNNISRELRTPMNSILGFSEILIRPGLEEQQRITYTRVLHKSIRKLLETVENTLTIAHLQTHQIVLNPIEFPVERLLTDSLREARVKLSEQEKNHIGVQLVGDCVGVYLRADFTKLQTCLNILIDNAIKFTEKGRIEIAFEAGESDVIFQISDTGSGFPEDKKHIAFQAFAQGDDQVRLNHGGLGLGLSICSGLIHLMRGRLELETKGKEGTRIRILLNKSMAIHRSA
ncbi:MAG: HAMP domain-containing sensor histidine kinase [Bacteroidales bacterium]